MGIRLAIESVEIDGTRVSVVLELDQPRIVLGRGAAADVILPHASVSGVHASLRSSASGYTVVDERSTNGTRVGSTRLVPERARALRAGEVLRIGPYSISITPGIAVAHASTGEDATDAAKRLVRLDAMGSLPGPAGTGVPDERALVFVIGPRAGERLVLPRQGIWTLGRGDEVEVQVVDAESSRLHAELVIEPEGVTLRDAGSKNGVVVNGRPTTTRRLRDGDEVTVGATQIAYEDARDRAVSAVAREPDDGPPEADPEPLALNEPAVDSSEPPPGPTADASTFDLVEEPSDSQRPGPRTGASAGAVAGASGASVNDVLADRFVFGLALVVLGLSAAAIAWIFGGF